MPSFDKTPKHIPDGDENLINAFSPIRTDVCPICKAKAVELFSFNGYPQNYREAVDAYLAGYDVKYDRYEIRSMKCRSCGKEFVIDWSDGFPKPLKDTFRSNLFFGEFVRGM